MRLILGSASPRRKEILGYFSLPFEQIPSDFPEETIAFEGNPKEYATILSQKKGESLRDKFPDSLIVTADTIVYANGRVYNKPRDRQEAFQFLTELSGSWHDIYTAVTMTKGNTSYSDIENTKVLFHTLTPQQISAYHDQFTYLDKAGGFAVEGSGNIILKRIEGCYYNILGLPMNPLRSLFLKMGIDLWNHLKS